MIKMSNGQTVAAIAFGWTAFCGGVGLLSNSLSSDAKFNNSSEVTTANISKSLKPNSPLDYFNLEGPFITLGECQQKVTQTFVSSSGLVTQTAERASHLHLSNDGETSFLIVSEKPLPSDTHKIKGRIYSTEQHFDSGKLPQALDGNKTFIQAEYALVGTNWLPLKTSFGVEP